MKDHPSPFTYQDKPEFNENIIGWFAITFKEDKNHEYIFDVYKDGGIYPQVYLDSSYYRDYTVFLNYLADPEVYSVIFTRQDGVRANYKWS